MASSIGQSYFARLSLVRYRGRFGEPGCGHAVSVQSTTVRVEPVEVRIQITEPSGAGAIARPWPYLPSPTKATAAADAGGGQSWDRPRDGRHTSTRPGGPG